VIKLSAFFVATTMIIGTAATAAPAAKSPTAAIAVSELTPGRFELVYSGAKFTSRDEVEGELLLSSARLSLAHGQQRFVLLAMPGEMTGVHPARTNPSYGAQFGHWEPHWSYYLPQTGWQPWHPEWGAEFWTKDTDPKLVERFQVHAMIQLGRDSTDENGSPAFNANDVVRDFGKPAEVLKLHDHH